jgi:hypothetical protein
MVFNYKLDRFAIIKNVWWNTSRAQNSARFYPGLEVVRIRGIYTYKVFCENASNSESGCILCDA